MTRTPTSRVRTTVPGTGELSRALEDARDRDSLRKFCCAHVCTADQVSEDGQRLHLPRVLQLMRDRGYQISDPKPAPHQSKRGFTAWLVHICIPRVEFDISFYTPDAVKPGAKKAAKPTPTPTPTPAIAPEQPPVVNVIGMKPADVVQFLTNTPGQVNDLARAIIAAGTDELVMAFQDAAEQLGFALSGGLWIQSHDLKQQPLPLPTDPSPSCSTPAATATSPADAWRTSARPFPTSSSMARASQGSP